VFITVLLCVFITAVPIIILQYLSSFFF